MAHKDTLLITRPELVSELLGKGINCPLVPNPFRPDKMAWSVELTPATAQHIATYYNERGIEIPQRVKKNLKEGDAE